MRTRLLSILLLVMAAGCGDDADTETPHMCGTEGLDCCDETPVCAAGLICVTGSDTQTCQRPDAGTDAGFAFDAGTTDAGRDAGTDAGFAADAGIDAGFAVDAGPVDAGTCCDRLGGSSSITWLASDGVLPDSTCPPWMLYDTAPTDAMISEGMLVIDTASDGDSITYSQEGTELLPGATVVIEFRMRLVSGTAVPSRAPAMIAGVFGHDRKFYLLIESGMIALTSDENARGPEAALDTTTAPRDYRIEIDIATGDIGVFVDGALTLTGSTFTSPDERSSYLSFGEGSIFAHGRSEWYSFRHDAYAGCAAP